MGMKAKKKYNLAIVGATGAVGGEFLQLLEKSSLPIQTLKLFSSERSAGKKLSFNGSVLCVESLQENSFENIDIAFFSAGSSVAKEFAPKANEKGAIVIDNSSAFRYDSNVPLIIPEVNARAIEAHNGIIANPNCTTIITLMALAPLDREAKLNRLIISSYQSISGAGAQAMAELEQQARDWASGKKLSIETQQHQILFNLYPHVDDFQDNGYTREEMKLLWEGRKILENPNLQVSATCVRVPVLRCHAISINAEFANPLDPGQARKILGNASGVVLVDDPENALYPMPLQHQGNHEVAVGRIREDLSNPKNGLWLWAVGDQLLKGAALNALQIAELLVHKEDKC